MIKMLSSENKDIIIIIIIIISRLFEEKRKDIVFGFPLCVFRCAWCAVPSL